MNSRTVNFWPENVNQGFNCVIGSGLQTMYDMQEIWVEARYESDVDFTKKKKEKRQKQETKQKQFAISAPSLPSSHYAQQW